MADQLEIKTPVFEGPMELLLELIEKRKLFINDISLSEVADDFLVYAEQADDFPVEQSSYFILIASTLLLIKSKSLLPNLQLTDEEQTHIDDLELRLALYRRFKELSEHITAQFGMRVSFLPLHPPDTAHLKPSFTPSDDLTMHNCVHAVTNVLNNMPTTEDIPQATVQKVMRLDDMIERLIQRVQNNLNTSFSEFTKTQGTDGAEQKKHVIISFLAMLELAKRGLIHVQQSERFRDIHMETRSLNTPHY